MILVVALPNATVGQKAEVGQGLPNFSEVEFVFSFKFRFRFMFGFML